MAINTDRDKLRPVHCFTVRTAALKATGSKWFKDVFHLDTYLFADAGTIVYKNSTGDNTFSEFRLDAGVGMALTIKRFGPLQKVKPLTFRFDIPFYLSHAPFDSDNIEFRWVVGVGRAF